MPVPVKAPLLVRAIVGRPPLRRVLAIGLVILVLFVAAVHLWTRETRMPVSRLVSLSESACPAVSNRARDGEVVSGGGTIPAGAVQVALCPLKKRNYFTVIAPRDPLTQDVDGLVDDVNSQDEFDSDACTAVGGFAYQLAFEYDDGTVRLVKGDTGGCGTIDAAGTVRDGAKRMFAAFTSRLQQQRRTASPPEQTQEASCAAPGGELGSISAIQDLEHLVSARVCVRYVFRKELNGSRPLAPAELTTINAELSAHPEDQPHLACKDRPEPPPELDLTLEAVDRWDDRVSVQLDSCLVFSLGGEAQQLSPRAQRIIDRIVTDIRQHEPSGLSR